MNSAFGGPGLRDAWPTAASRGLTPASHCSRPSRARRGEFGVCSGALTSVGFSSHFPAQGERGWTCDQTHCPLNFILQNWAWGLGRLSGLLGFTPMWESPVCGPGPRECTDEDGVRGPSCDTSSLRGGADSRHPTPLVLSPSPLAGRRKRQFQTSPPTTSQKHCEPVKIRSLLFRTSQFLKSLRFNPHGRPQVAGQGWELTPALGGGDRQGAESRSADHVRDTRGSSHRACAPAPASAQR